MMRQAKRAWSSAALVAALFILPGQGIAQEVFWSKGTSVGGGTAAGDAVPSMPAIGGDTQSDIPTITSSASNSGSTAAGMMSEGQLQAILRSATPAVRQLSALPAGVDPTKLSLSAGSSPGSATVRPGGTPEIASDLSAIANAVKTQSKANVSQGLSDGRSTDNYGTLYGYNSVYHYTDRLVDLNSYGVYPQSTVGFFVHTFNNQNWFYCTASMISKSIIVLAGHCVHKGGTGSQNDWIKQGYFYPACFNCNASSGLYTPYGYSYWLGASTTAGWYYSGGDPAGIDKGFDVAAVALGKRAGTSSEMGNYTGWLGFCTGYCLQPYWYLTQYGYPSNYYGGNWMFEGQHLEVADGYDYILGSGAEGGSSGGPHIANVGYMSETSNYVGQWSSRNIVFAVTSWGYKGASYKIQGASPLTGRYYSGSGDFNNFRGIYNTVCGYAQGTHGASSCSTY